MATPDLKNEAFYLLRLIDLKFEIDIIDVNVFKKEYPKIFEVLP